MPMVDVMPALSSATLSALWARAAAAEIGIAIKTSDKPLLKTLLYEARKSLGGFANIMVCDVVGEELWLVKKETQVEP